MPCSPCIAQYIYVEQCFPQSLVVGPQPTNNCVHGMVRSISLDLRKNPELEVVSMQILGAQAGSAVTVPCGDLLRIPIVALWTAETILQQHLYKLISLKHLRSISALGERGQLLVVLRIPWPQRHAPILEECRYCHVGASGKSSTSGYD